MSAHTPSEPDASGPIHVETLGDGIPVVLVHGSLATAAEEWTEQLPLAAEGLRLLMPDRRGYGRSPAAGPVRTSCSMPRTSSILMGDGAHLVGHSYGGLGVMFAAARPSRGDPVARAARARRLRPWGRTIRRRRVVRRAGARHVGPANVPGRRVGGRLPPSPSAATRPRSPPDFLAAALPLVPVFRNGRPIFAAELPLAAARRSGPSRSWSSPAATVPASTPSATTSPSGSAPARTESWRAPATRSSSPVRPSTQSFASCGRWRRETDRQRAVQVGPPADSGDYGAPKHSA